MISRDRDASGRTVLPTRPRLRATFVATLALTSLLSGCVFDPSSEGDRRAERAADEIATTVGAHTANTPEITLLEMVAWWVPGGADSPGNRSRVVEALAWSGESAGSHATIDIRVTVNVEAQPAAHIFGQSWPAGSATKCYRLVWERYEPARRSDIPCPDGPAPARPTPEPRPKLTEADRQRVVEIVADQQAASDMAQALREAFPQDYISVETESADGGVVAAVGIPAERDCILAFRDAAGAITFPRFRPISLEPGEIGCSTTLYTHPPF